MSNPETRLTLDEAVAEVLGLLTGMDLTYVPEYDRYYAITRQLNRAMRAVAVEHEWSYYSDTVSIGAAVEGVTTMTLPETLRPRIVGDDAVRLVDEDNVIRVWAYFLPRDALHKYGDRIEGLWCAIRRDTIMFSRPFYNTEVDLDVQVPVMREPTMFRLPARPEDEFTPVTTVPDDVRDQEIDFWYPDLVILRAAYYVAQTDPVMQPRVQTLDAQYKDMLYQILERDDRSTDSPYQNEFFVPIEGSLRAGRGLVMHGHPHSDGRR